MEFSSSVDDYVDLLQNKTIQSVDSDSSSVALVLSDGITVHFFSDNLICMATERHTIN